VFSLSGDPAQAIGWFCRRSYSRYIIERLANLDYSAAVILGVRTMKLVFALVSVLAAGGLSHEARAEDWRFCHVLACENGQCGNLATEMLIVAPTRFDDPAYGDAGSRLTKLNEFAAHQYPAASGWTIKDYDCSTGKPSNAEAMEASKRFIAYARESNTRVMIAAPEQIWAATAATRPESTPSPAPAPKPVPKAAEKATPPSERKPQYVEPMQFVLSMGLREPTGGINTSCFSNIITLPAPEGYRGEWPTLKNALPIIQSYFANFQAACAKRGTPYGSVSFTTDDGASPASINAARARIRTQVDTWQRYRFPEVFVAR